MTSSFYRAFEEKYRGPREVIKERLRVYLPFVEPLKALYSDCRAIDLGCGRGEWLELLQEAGIAAHGVDLDESMLAGCREKGLSVAAAEAVASLNKLPDESQGLVSAFHVAEHIPFAQLQSLVQEALRVLRPAGLLILETPNPENLSVGTASFYLDPTHQRPLPPGLLSFLPEHYGFHRTKILRLQEPPGLASDPSPSLINVLRDVSPDYAVVAQKKSTEAQLAPFAPAFDKKYGLTLDELATRYDAAAQARLERVENIERQVLASKSWRVTAPFRAAADTLKRIFGKQ